MNAAISEYKKNNFTKAEAKLRKIIEQFPDYALAYVYLGHTLNHMVPPKPIKAETAYRQALAACRYNLLKPDEYVYLLDNLGMIRMNFGDYAEAEELFRRAVNKKTGYPVAYFNYGCMLARRGLYDAAAVSFAEAVRRDKHFVNYVANHTN